MICGLLIGIALMITALGIIKLSIDDIYVDWSLAMMAFFIGLGAFIGGVVLVLKSLQSVV